MPAQTVAAIAGAGSALIANSSTSTLLTTSCRQRRCSDGKISFPFHAAVPDVSAVFYVEILVTNLPLFKFGTYE